MCINELCVYSTMRDPAFTVFLGITCVKLARSKSLTSVMPIIPISVDFKIDFTFEKFLMLG